MVNDGGSAFPFDFGDTRVYPDGYRLKEVSQGMTLRDYFAAKAMQGLLDYKRFREDIGISNPKPESISVWAYQYADAMLSQRRSDSEPATLSRQKEEGA